MKFRIFLMLFCAVLAINPIYPEAEEYSDQSDKNGWYEEGGSRYYYMNNQLVKGWFFLDGNWYYFNKSDGAVYVGWLNDDGKWYFLESSGAMKRGWLQFQGKWYFLDNRGIMQTGWINESGKWYFLSNGGAMLTGWVNDGGKWYFLGKNGSMQTGWLYQNNRWYYLNPSGVMEIGWIYLNKWYYFNHNGIWIPSTIADQFTTISKNNQLILVTTSGYNTYKAKIRTFEKIDHKWHEKLAIDGYIGKEGFATVMREGAKKSPRGKYTIGTAFGRFQNPGTRLPYRQITSNDVWVDDPNSSLYNTWQSASNNNGRWSSAEKMDIPAYNYGFVINYNTKDRIPGAGSAIFFHVAGSYTLGCTGTAQTHVLSILKWLDPDKHPVIIQTPESELSNY